MRFEDQDRVKKQAGDETVIILRNWRRRMRRYRMYRLCLCVALFCSCATLAGYEYYALDKSIPSVIHVRADELETFHLGIPAKGELVSVGAQGESNIPKDAVTIDLSEPVTLKTGGLNNYSMEVKLFGFLPFKQIGIEVIEDRELIPVGIPVGIYMESEGVLVVGVGNFKGMDGQNHCPAQHILKSGDYIRKLNGQAITDKESFIRGIEESDGRAQIVTVERLGELVELQVKPEKDAGGRYKIGAWVRDSTQGVGTMTYIDGDGNFGALGHGINDVDTSTLMEMYDGTIYRTEIIAIQKGMAGNPGEMTGMIVYSDDNILGDIVYNGEEGIFGKCNQQAILMAQSDPLPIGLKQEIERGDAEILCTVDGEPQYYDIRITDIHLDHDNVNRGIELVVTDPELLEKTGGIVQGMSGAPIIQNGKIVGAVTHVLVQDSSKGYGIFIENMLEH
ncbi:MAG: SpoIVB peptidase [Clostridium sp.]|nr:SpoIVB peptidase [Acetatifactor muris]MCM1527010.1 SpoIVB peptidase [Bacteroides sp.]MCM1561986.1 SpoIVB peptidase [Clostridium sp.]